MKNLPIIASVLGALLIIGGAVAFSMTPSEPDEQVVENVRMEGDTQIVEIDVKGGYSPMVSTAQAGIPTVLRLKTNGTYDCSAAVRIQDLGIRQNLEATGVADIEIAAESAQGTVQGTCIMGMYNFSIKFM